MTTVRLAILDMYTGVANEGMRCIRQLIRRAEAANQVHFATETFDVRGQNQLPALADFDVFISSGGPGSPLASGEAWEAAYFRFIDALFAHNLAGDDKKHLLLICHSFQLVSRHLGLGELSQRKSTSFGVMPVHLTPAGHADPVLHGLPEPFFAVDSRDYQLTHPDLDHLAVLGAEVLCLEKKRPHVALTRAVMAIRFSPEVIGTQFHPEADGEGMLRYMRTAERKQQVITAYGEEKYDEMVHLLADPTTIEVTEGVVIPNFLRLAVAQLVAVAVAVA